MKRNTVKQFVEELKNSLSPLCDSEKLLYTCFNRFVTEKYISAKNLNDIKDFLYLALPDIFNEKTSNILKRINIYTDVNLFENIAIFDLCFQHYNFDESGFLKKTQFYTPQKFVEEICEKIISREIKTVLEPACGAGTFLRNLYKISKKKGIPLNIKAFDIDERAIQLSKISFSVYVYEKFGERIVPDIEKKDFLLEKTGEKYDCILGNPPFLGRKFMPKKYMNYLKSNFNCGAENLSYGFLLKSLSILNQNGKLGFVMPDNFIYLENTKNMKTFIQNHFETEIIKVEKCLFKDIKGSNFSPCIIYLKNKKPIIKNKVSEKMLTVGDIAQVVTGIQTGNNEKYVRHFSKILPVQRAKNLFQNGKKWYPYLKGGGYKKWSGNDDYFIYYENNGEKLRKEKGSIIRNENFFKQEGITYSYYCENRFSARYKEKGAIFDIGGSCLFFENEEDLYYVLALLNSSVGAEILIKMNPTMSFQTSTIKKLPVIFQNKKEIATLSKKAVELSKKADKFLNSSKYFKIPDFIKNSKADFEQSFLDSEYKFLKLKNNLSLIEKEINKNFETIYNIYPKEVYTPKPLNIKKIRKQMLEGFFEWLKVKNSYDVTNFIKEKYPNSFEADIHFIAKIINGKTFNDVKGTIEKAISKDFHTKSR